MKKKKNTLYELERKYGRFAISNLTMWMIGLYVIGLVASLINPTLLNYLTLDPAAILHGQVWRILTFLVVPPDTSFLVIITLIFYASIGRSLEQAWGDFLYNLYILVGLLFIILGDFVVYLIFGVSIQASTYYLLMSLLLAFATVFPDMQVMLYFIIPLKIKWLGYFYAAMIGFDIIQNVRVLIICIKEPIYRSSIGIPIGQIICIVLSLLNFILFFLWTRKAKRPSSAQRKRTKQFKKAVQNTVKDASGARHKCAICGRTELTNPELTFRYCSKCKGNYEYCNDHLFTHTHIK